MKSQTYVILAIILLILVAIFAVVNVDPVEVNYIFWSGESPLVLVILFSVLMGGVITAGVGAKKIIQLQREVKSLRKQNEKQQAPTETKQVSGDTEVSKDEKSQDESVKTKNTL
ncbi:lipopolysaccharide assembly LapA domain-containing protein [Virgibacillus xinjiangensis]|uniref:Lipopolysaccharide assembly LapA domain-containing protein n=1 Tax=Virgibacillus xinjiangensis TaxID=393090 RepID=A0ABV7CSD7_9BACI